ncbi:tyrosine-type recombinase/integrase [Fictibacillus sp. NPDC058756]|uniref:tyrosine-type recombinase/integrase n=1 Tax=Fictibacillus sp. NPDC058756 TaxID=3346625 RepID=UPI0036A7715B
MSQEVIVDQFIMDNQFRLEPKSLQRYKLSVDQFFKHTGKSLDAIKKSDIRHWLVHLKGEGYKPHTIWTNLTGLKTFFKYCLEEGHIIKNPASEVPFPRIEEKLPYYLSFEQLDNIRKLIGDRLQERAILEVLYATGMRISEMCSMKKEDINWSEQIVHIPIGKRKKGRIVPFSRNCAVYLKAYLDSRIDNSPYVFLTLRSKGRPISQSTVKRMFRAYSKCLGYRVTPHTLRHTFAAHLASKGMPLECIQVILGHEQPHLTQYYARLYNHARKEGYDWFM